MTNPSEVFAMIRQGELRPFKQLIELHGASLEIKYVSGYTPLMEACYLEQLDFVMYICEHMKKKYGVHSSEFKRYLNATSIDGKSAVMIATLSNASSKVVKYLMSEKCDLSIKDLHKKSLRDYIEYSSSDEVENYWRQQLK